MSVNKQETIAEIVAEMRTFKCTNLVTCKREECTAISKYLADRIEAAHKREMEKESSCSVRSTKEAARIIVRNGIVNVAKMYEALVNISKYADCAAMRQHDAHTQHYIEQIRKWAEAALAEPVTPAASSSAPHAAPRADLKGAKA